MTWARGSIQVTASGRDARIKGDVLAEHLHSSTQRRWWQLGGNPTGWPANAEANCSDKPLWVIASHRGREPCDGAEQYAESN